MAKEDPNSNTRLIPPLLTTLPHSILQHQAGLHLQTTTNSPTFNLLQFPALKKMLNVQSSQQKQLNHSAFSALKAQQGIFFSLIHFRCNSKSKIQTLKASSTFLHYT